MTTYEWLALITVIIGGFWTLHKDLQNFVRREDCDREMGEHCRLTQQLDMRLGKAENRLSIVETKVGNYHPNR